MACSDEPLESFASLADLIVTHRSRYVEEYADRNRRIFIAKERYLLFFVIIAHRERALGESRDITTVCIGYSQRQGDEISLYSKRGLRIVHRRSRLRLRHLRSDDRCSEGDAQRYAEN